MSLRRFVPQRPLVHIHCVLGLDTRIRTRVFGFCEETRTHYIRVQTCLYSFKMKITNLSKPSPGHAGLGLMHVRMSNADRTLQAEQTYFSSLVPEDSPKFYNNLDSAKLEARDRLKLVAEALEKSLEQFPDACETEMPCSLSNLEQFPDASESEMQTWYMDGAKRVKF